MTVRFREGSPLVRTEKVGKKRPFWRGFLLTVVTFGIYGLYWLYKAPKEIHRQFELMKEGRDDAVVWLLIGLVVPVVRLVYEYKMVDNVRYVRERLGIEDGIEPGWFVGLRVISQVLMFAMTLVILTSLPETAIEQTPGVVFGALGATFLAGFGLIAYVFWRLQTDINTIWDRWEQRVEELGDHEAELSPSGRSFFNREAWAGDPGP